MKKTTLIAGALLFIGASLSSCTKNYTCTCSKTYTTGNGSSTKNYSVYTYDDTKTTATTRCNANENTGSDLGGNYSINCSIE
ncbi:MAG TPA: hypothetical protein VNX01_06555 [Bacteroidia bacterium]|jgi:hypothetical protein|nr:hypothetical protein [Bacteroidia bacterium]